MNIIEALQALKDGKKICRTGSCGGLYTCLSPTGMIVDQDGNPNPFMIDCIAALVEDWYSWNLYTEPIKLTAEERKALKLAKACGYDLLWYDACFLWAHVRGEYEVKVADDEFPPLRALKGLFPRATNPTSVDSLLEEGK